MPGHVIGELEVQLFQRVDRYGSPCDESSTHVEVAFEEPHGAYHVAGGLSCTTRVVAWRERLRIPVHNSHGLLTIRVMSRVARTKGKLGHQQPQPPPQPVPVPERVWRVLEEVGSDPTLRSYGYHHAKQVAIERLGREAQGADLTDGEKAVLRAALVGDEDAAAPADAHPHPPAAAETAAAAPAAAATASTPTVPTAHHSPFFRRRAGRAGAGSAPGASAARTAAGHVVGSMAVSLFTLLERDAEVLAHRMCGTPPALYRVHRRGPDGRPPGAGREWRPLYSGALGREGPAAEPAGEVVEVGLGADWVRIGCGLGADWVRIGW